VRSNVKDAKVLMRACDAGMHRKSIEAARKLKDSGCQEELSAGDKSSKDTRHQATDQHQRQSQDSTNFNDVNDSSQRHHSDVIADRPPLFDDSTSSAGGFFRTGESSAFVSLRDSNTTLSSGHFSSRVLDSVSRSLTSSANDW
jgi:hypothetical protein